MLKNRACVATHTAHFIHGNSILTVLSKLTSVHLTQHFKLIFTKQNKFDEQGNIH